MKRNSLFVFCTALLIVFSAASTMFYDFSLWTTHLNAVHEDSQDALAISQYLLDYFKELHLQPPSIPRFTQNELSHLRDVKSRILAFYNLLPIAWIAWLYVLLKKKRPSEQLAKGGLAGLSTLLLSIIPFPILFGIMHVILFPQGNWLFTPDHIMVQLYPPAFWILMAKTLAARIFLLSSLFIVVGNTRTIERLL